MSAALVTKRRRKQSRKGDPTQAAVGKFAGDAYSLGKRALQGVNTLRKLINIETKYFNLTATVNPTQTPNVIYVSAVTQGVTATTRLGNSFRLQGMSLDMWVSKHASSTANDAIRVILFRDLECQGTSPAIEAVLEDASSPYPAVLSPPDYVNATRYSILLDERIHLSADTSLPSVQTYHYSIPHNGHIKYRGQDATLSSAAEGAIFMIIVCMVNTNTPTVIPYFRMLYTDD
jgi:hypothetical protein